MLPAEVEILSTALQRHSIGKEKKLFSQGDFGDCFYIVVRGQIDIRLQTTEHHYKRLAAFGPGTVFGEVAFFDPGTRVADAIATYKSELLSLDRQAMKELYQTNPEVALSVFSALGRLLSNNIRWSAREIKRLSQW